jgi:hypothetical protein
MWQTSWFFIEYGLRCFLMLMYDIDQKLHRGLSVPEAQRPTNPVIISSHL